MSALRKTKDIMLAEEGVPGLEDLSIVEEAEIINLTKKKENECPLYVESKSNIELFQIKLEKSSEKVHLLLKKWISASDAKSIQALQTLGQVLPANELEKCLNGLSLNERNRWKSFLAKNIDGVKIHESSSFIKEEMKRDLIGPELVNDKELVDLIFNMPKKASIDFILSDNEFVGVYLNLLDANTLAVILNQLPKDHAKYYMNIALKFDFSQITDNFQEFKKYLKDYNDKNQRSPFYDQLIGVLSHSNSRKELMIYNFLAKEGRFEEIQSLAKKNVPIHLIIDLPKDVLKEVLQNFDEQKQIMLFCCIEKEKEQKLLDCLAGKGSTGRELLDSEIKSFKSDKLNQSLIAGDNGESWLAFVSYCRQYLAQKAELSKKADSIINIWISELKEKVFHQ